jgi:hypothetical protein
MDNKGIDAIELFRNPRLVSGVANAEEASTPWAKSTVALACLICELAETNLSTCCNL